MLLPTTTYLVRLVILVVGVARLFLNSTSNLLIWGKLLSDTNVALVAICVRTINMVGNVWIVNVITFSFSIGKRGSVTFKAGQMAAI